MPSITVNFLAPLTEGPVPGEGAVTRKGRSTVFQEAALRSSARTEYARSSSVGPTPRPTPKYPPRRPSAGSFRSVCYTYVERVVGADLPAATQRHGLQGLLQDPRRAQDGRRQGDQDRLPHDGAQASPRRGQGQGIRGALPGGRRSLRSSR